jgi:outer membrane protein assembly factor BamB
VNQWYTHRANIQRTGAIQSRPIESGVEKWVFQTNGPVTSSPSVVNNTVYIGSQDKKLYALDVKDGSLKWAFCTEVK